MSQTTHSCVFIVYVKFVNSTEGRGYRTGDNNVSGWLGGAPCDGAVYKVNA